MNLFYGAWLDNFPDAIVSGQLVLDIGCGHGHDTRTLLAAGLHVVALDLNPGNVRRAIENAPAASFLVADVRTGLPFRDNTFNLAVASLSLHYFDRATTDRILRDIHRVTTTGATLLSRVNVVGDIASLWGVGIEHEQDYFEVEPGHYKRFYTEESLRDTLDPYFYVDRLFPMATLVQGRHPKQTLVTSATRRDT
jgi:ubiquinone/menaquinone biosynthesis C-methylase UbiE